MVRKTGTQALIEFESVDDAKVRDFVLQDTNLFTHCLFSERENGSQRR